jgi:copper homeostasis protein
MTPRTAARIVAMTGIREIHTAALAPVQSGMRFRRPDVFMGGTLRPPEYDRLDTAAGDVAALITAARG